jgi:hypothetical protein
MKKHINNGIGEAPLSITTFHMQKSGNAPEEYEDSYNYSTEKRKIAVADGATESCFSKLWADLLTQSFVGSKKSLFSLTDLTEEKAREFLEPILVGAQKEWNARIDWKGLSWSVEEKTREGAFATFIGLELDGDEGKDQYRWRVIAIGDCCLFYLDANSRIIESFPLTSSAQFGNTPAMLSSRHLSNIYVDRTVCAQEGKAEAGHKLILTTDAVAKWILQETEACKNGWTDIILRENEDRTRLFEDLIESGKMRNDDITILILAT